MSALGIISAKRMLPEAAWLLLPVGVAAGKLSQNGLQRRQRTILLGALAVIAAIGWFGIFSRTYYSAPRFIEPWDQVAAEAAGRIESGELLIGNNPSFFFYLSYKVQPQFHGIEDGDAARVWLPSQALGIFDASDWLENGHPLRERVFLVRGAPGPVRAGPAWDAEQWLDGRCRMESERQLLHDPASPLKARFFPELGELPWRVRIREYICGDADRERHLFDN